MRSGEPRFPGIVGYDDTVLPEVERALLAGHDMVLLGERGQGKTRLIRAPGRRCSTSGRPVIAGSELNEHPYAPAHPGVPAGWSTRPATTLPVAWLHRSHAVRREARHPGHQRRRPDRRRRPDPGRRRAARSATRRPSTSASCRAPTAASSPSTSCPTWPSGSRCRCSTCWRSATSRSAATSCGCRWTCCWWPAPTRRTTPTGAGSSRRSRTGSAPRSAPTTRSTWSWRSALIRQEAALVAAVPEHVLEVLARFARAVRESPAVDARSGVSARFAIAAAETVAGVRAAPGRAARRAASAVARIGDTVSVTSTLRGKVEFESGEEGREIEILAHLLRTATAETFRARLAGLDLSGFTDLVAEGDDHRDRRAGRRPTSCCARSAPCRAWPRCWTGSASATRPAPGEAAAGVEFVLEGLHLTRRLAKDADRRRPHPSTASREAGDVAGRVTGVTGTAPGRAGPTRSPRRTTCAPRSTQVGERGARRRQPARRAARPAAPRPAAAAAAWTTCTPGPAGCAGTRCAGATSTAR